MGTEDSQEPVVPPGVLTGTLVSSLHRLKDVNNLGGFQQLNLQKRRRVPLIPYPTCLDGGFFVFGDLSIRLEGEFKLLFDLFEMRG